MLLCNFTPDEIEWVHGGIHGFLKPGEIEEYADARGNHILNQYQRRGILRYNLKDDDEAKRREAMGLYKRFWEHQITVFNEQNEARKNENKPYNFPSEQLKQKAEEFGVTLVAPWAMQPRTDSSQVSELKAKHMELENMVKTLSDGLQNMTALLQQIAAKPAVPVVQDTADLIKKFITLDKHKYKNWVLERAEEIKGWPTAVQKKAQEKWETFYPDMEWPLSE